MPITVIVRPTTEGAAARDPAGTFALSLTFDGPRIVLGRGPGSDVRLPDASVSLRHATIRATGTTYAIVDEASTNGTWVGGVKLAPQVARVIKSGDLVRVGRVWLEIVIGYKPATPDLGLATKDLALALVRRAMDAMGDDTVMKVRVAEGPDVGAEVRLFDEGRSYVIGRAAHCDLPLADEDASREYAAVIRHGASVTLRDLGSRNGVFLGDLRISPAHEVLWRPTAMVKLGRTVLALDEPVTTSLALLEQREDERIPDADTLSVPPPSVGSLATLGFDRESLAAPSSLGAPISMAVNSGQGPIAHVETRAAKTSVAPRKQRRVWTITDLVVLVLALTVIGASLAGLVWVLK